MTPDDELTAIALWVQRTQGANAQVYMAEQIGALALRGETAGIERWKAVAGRFQELATEARH